MAQESKKICGAVASGSLYLRIQIESDRRRLESFFYRSRFQNVALLCGMPQTPAKRSAGNSKRTENWLATLGFCVQGSLRVVQNKRDEI